MSHVKRLLPNLNFSLRKGSCGKIAIIGGSEEYTGAPTFAATSVTKLGADLVHVICSPHASSIIKGFNPDFIVYTYTDEEAMFEKLQRIDAIVVGPGLGRSIEFDRARLIRKIVAFADQKNIPIVLDGDALWYVSQFLDICRNKQLMILTPNIVEFSRIVESALNIRNVLTITDFNEIATLCKKVSKEIGVSIFLKGKIDMIANADGSGDQLEEEGSPRRCGGQGDTTAGTLALFLLWAIRKEKNISQAKIEAGLACSQMIKMAARIAFEKEGRSMVTSDLLNAFSGILKKLDAE